MLYMFHAVPQPIIRSSKPYTQHRVFVEFFLLLTAIVSELSVSYNSLTIAVRNKKARQIPDAVYTVLGS